MPYPRLLLPLLGLAVPALAATTMNSIVSPDLVFAETNGLVSVEAEHFTSQTLTDRRAWHLTAPGHDDAAITPDGDGRHLVGASGGAYLELLPDERRTHYQPIIVGESFTNTGGAMAVLNYRVHFNTPGRYYVWVRALSTGGEDNGLHAGLDHTWPESGLRWQTGHKNKWAWDSRQRTDAVPQGERHKLYLDVPTPGEHTVHFSMREDGFEFDRWLLTTDRDYMPADEPAAATVFAGHAPAPFALPAGYTDPADASREHDGSGLAMMEGDFRPGGTVTLVLSTETASLIPASSRMEVAFTHESGEPVLIAAGRHAGEGRWRAPFTPDRPGQWYFSVHFHDRLSPDEPSGHAVKRYHQLSGIFPVSPR